MDEEQHGYLALMAYALLVGAVGVAVKTIDGLGAYSILSVRVTLATAFLFLVLVATRRLKSLKVIHRNLVLVALFNAASILLFFGALFRTSISASVFLLYTAPIFSVLIGRFVLREKISRRTYLGILLTTAGILFIIDPTTFSWNAQQTVGNLMGLGAGFCYAAMTIAAKPVMRDSSPLAVVFWETLLMMFLLLGFFPPSLALIQANLGQLLFLGIAATGIGYTLFLYGEKRVPEQNILIVSTVEPFFAALLAFLVLTEVPKPVTIVGAFFVILGVFETTRRKRSHHGWLFHRHEKQLPA